MSTSLHFAIEVKQKDKWKPLEWYSKYPSFYNKEPHVTPLWKRYFQLFRNYKLHMQLLGYKWYELPKAIAYSTDGYIKDMRERYAWEPGVPFGNGKLYKKTVLYFDNFLFRDYYIRNSSTSPLAGCGLPSDLSPEIAKFANEKWTHSKTHFTLSELWEECEKEKKKLIESISKRTSNRLLLNIAKKVGADTDVELDYEDYTDEEWIEEVSEKYYAATRAYYALATVVDEVLGSVSEENVRVIVWAS